MKASRKARRPRQLQLEYRGWWGGRRRGAGRKPTGERASVSHLRRRPLASRNPVFVTLRVGKHVESLRSREVYPGVLSALMAARGRNFRVLESSVQEDHVHLICEPTDRDALSRGMEGLGVRLACAMGTRGNVFADRCRDRIYARRGRSGLGCGTYCPTLASTGLLPPAPATRVRGSIFVGAVVFGLADGHRALLVAIGDDQTAEVVEAPRRLRSEELRSLVVRDDALLAHDPLPPP